MRKCIFYVGKVEPSKEVEALLKKEFGEGGNIHHIDPKPWKKGGLAAIIKQTSTTAHVVVGSDTPKEQSRIAWMNGLSFHFVNNTEEELKITHSRETTVEHPALN